MMKIFERLYIFER